jgi:hypothetical protein
MELDYVHLIGENLTMPKLIKGFKNNINTLYVCKMLHITNIPIQESDPSSNYQLAAI